MATENFQYISYLEALLIHFEVMRFFGETHIGVADRSLIESALARRNKQQLTKLPASFGKQRPCVLG